jgi:hypothetical protein
MAAISKKQPIKKPLTNDEKLLYAGGAVLLLGGGAIWYFRNKKEKEQEESTDYGTVNTQVEVSNPVVPKPPRKPVLATPNISNEVIQVPIRTNENFAYPVGQQVMANGYYGTQTYVARKKADGSYFSKGEKYVKFENGDAIGTIIWVGKMSNGTYRYVVKRTGSLGVVTYYWIADTKVIKPIGKKLPIVNPNASHLDSNKLLKRGVKGNEVKELQRRLKITADGDFGKKTETALLHQKKLSQIRLKDWR